MNPALIELLKPLLEQLGPIAVSKTLPMGKKLIEACLDSFQGKPRISMSFVDASNHNEPGINKEIQLTQPLSIVDNYLSLPLSYQENQILAVIQKISDDLDIIKGQNDILFLSNSIGYFIDSHRYRVGIDHRISYALQYDLKSVFNHLNENKSLRFPGYLQHQVSSLCRCVRDLNIFYSSILFDGHVPSLTEEEIFADFSKEYGVDNRKSEIGNYIPHDIKLRVERNRGADSERKGKKITILSSVKDHLFWDDPSGSVSVMASEPGSAIEAIYLLKEELVSNQALEDQIAKRIDLLPHKKLYIRS